MTIYSTANWNRCVCSLSIEESPHPRLLRLTDNKQRRTSAMRQLLVRSSTLLQTLSVYNHTRHFITGTAQELGREGMMVAPRASLWPRSPLSLEPSWGRGSKATLSGRVVAGGLRIRSRHASITDSRARAVRGPPHRRRHWRIGIIYKSTRTGGRRISRDAVRQNVRLHRAAPEVGRWCAGISA
ncbi:unnamed protein product, partial [Iphiclides podalirius]